MGTETGDELRRDAYFLVVEPLCHYHANLVDGRSHRANHVGNLVTWNPLARWITSSASLKSLFSAGCAHETQTHNHSVSDGWKVSELFGGCGFTA